ncbi:MAG TPA: MarR family transcriptional regulator [Bradyrhizobium sp.]|nr:MarR family transcriptional regulator [Bradyrhizobium sp.]
MPARILQARARPAKRPRRSINTSNKAQSSPRKREVQQAGSKAKAVDLGDLSQSLGYRIRRAQLWVFREVSQRLTPFEISPAQFSVLSVIDANPGVNQLAIAQLLSIERAGLGRMVDHLERRSLVSRTASSINRRYYVLYLTREGTELLARLRPIIAGSEKSLVEKIGPRAYAQFQRTLSIFLDD